MRGVLLFGEGSAWKKSLDSFPYIDPFSTQRKINILLKTVY